MKFMELNKSFAHGFSPVYNLKGEDYFLIKQAITNIKSATIKSSDEFNFVRVDGEKMKGSELRAMLSVLPFGSDYRICVVDHPNVECVKVINNFEFFPELIVVTINAEKLRVGVDVDCSKLDKSDTTKYIVGYLKKYNLSITEEAKDYIISSTDNVMSNIANELTKITAYCVSNSVVTIDIVTNLVSNSTEYVTYMLTNAIDNKDYKTFQQIVNVMNKNSTFGEIYSYIGKYFKRMQYIALNKNDDELAKIFSLKPYAITMSRKNISKNGVKYYINLYSKYVELDEKIKSGKISAENALYSLIF